MQHEVACLLGYWHHEHARLTDPDAPTGAILLPHDPIQLARNGSAYQTW